MSHSTRSGSVQETANDAFKRNASNWLAYGIIGAVAVHFALFAFFPNLQAADLSGSDEAIETIELPPEVQIPPPPEQISRPATPRVAAADIAEDVTIAPTTFESNPVENLPPPPKTGSPADRPSFIPYDVAPKLKNASEIQKLLQRLYPSQLREAGIEGTVVLWIYIDENGVVLKTQVQKTSGYEAMDKAAMGTADKMKFSPAMNRDKKTPVWVAQAITFEVR
ncbi:MAG: energy transducer TonB [Gemmatimonadota bacterium]|nr:MAG: energy transducer TonB [Gemmatimonadota bacterium]